MYQLSSRYQQKRAFITGAASGLGKALCLELAADGWTIGISDINEIDLQQTADAIIKAGGKPLSFGLDVADADNYRMVAEKFLTETDGIDLLVNNAGVGDGAVFEKYSLDNWQWMVGINQMGVIYGCHFFVPVMKKQQSGHIINIASAAAFSNAPTMSPYNVTKAAVLSLSETLLAELKQDNIHLSVVMPTFFRTNIVQYAKGTKEEKEIAKYLLATSGLEADEVAQTILKKAGNRKFYIVLPARSKFLYVFKRLFPSLFLKMNVWMFKNKEKMHGSLKKQFEKLPDNKKELWL
jgi:NAD(P)-dependent dehydrogenase (short-subunit alcohol dehydrogenase family)